MAQYLIWSNEHRAWWRPGSCGYTINLAEAGFYPREQAMSICANARNGWKEGKPPPEIPVLATDAWEALTTATAKRARGVGDRFAEIVAANQ